MFPKAQIISTKPGLKLGQHLVDGYRGAIPVSAAFVFARDHFQGLQGWAMAFAWVP